MNHDLKCDHDQFELMLQGKKKFDARFNDRDFKVGDTLIEHETHFSASEMREGNKLIFTGRKLNCLVTHMMQGPITAAWGLGEFPPKGVAIMSISGGFLQTDQEAEKEYKIKLDGGLI